MRRTIINGIAAAILDRIDCSFFAKKIQCSYLSCSKNYLGPKKIIFGALMRHFFQTLVIFHKLRIKIVETMLSLNNYHYQTAFKTWGLILIFFYSSFQSWSIGQVITSTYWVSGVRFLMYKIYSAENWPKTVNPALRGDTSTSPPAIWGSHCQLDDHHINSNINNKDHLDG